MMRALKLPWRYAACDANPAPARNGAEQSNDEVHEQSRNTKHGVPLPSIGREQNRTETAKPRPTCPLVEGDVHPLTAAVEREVGVPEQLRVALPQGEGRRLRRGNKLARGGSS